MDKQGSKTLADVLDEGRRRRRIIRRKGLDIREFVLGLFAYSEGARVANRRLPLSLIRSGSKP